LLRLLHTPLALCALAFLAFAVAGCGKKSGGAADETFKRVAEAYLADVLRTWPTQATYLGSHEHDGQLEDYSPAAVAQAASMYEKHRENLRQIDAGRLSPSAQIDYELVAHDIESSLFSLTRLQQHTWDPNLYNETLGFSHLLLTLLDDKSDLWPARLASLLSRLRQVPHFLETAKRNVADSSRTLVEFTIEQNAGNVSFFRDALPPLFDRAPDLKAQLAEANAAAVAAMDDYGRWLKEDLLPRCGRDWRLGRELWTEKLRYTLRSALTPDEILSRAEEAIRLTRQEMLQIAEPMHARLFPAHKHAEQGDERINVIVREVIEHVSRKHSTPDSLFADVKTHIDTIKKFVRERQIITLPPDTDNLVIEPTPGFLNGLAVAFFYPPPALEPHLKKAYWISSVPSTGDPARDRERQESFLREYNHYGLQCLTIHEAFPGHYVQHFITQSSPVLTVYKKAFESGTFVEGWAVLIEKILFEEGYGADDPATLLIHKKISLRSPMNAILDAKLHTGAMSDEEADAWALDLMVRQGFQERTEAQGKLRRAKVTATQLSTYFVGLTEMEDMYRDARRKMGDAFVLKEFLDKVPSYGALPPAKVRQLLFADLKL
jgi:uncharacterized protein (DUF885 family)